MEYITRVSRALHLVDNKVMDDLHCWLHPISWLMDGSVAGGRYDNLKLAHQMHRHRITQLFCCDEFPVIWVRWVLDIKIIEKKNKFPNKMVTNWVIIYLLVIISLRIILKIKQSIENVHDWEEKSLIERNRVLNQSK